MTSQTSRPTHFRWSFWSASAVVLFAVVVGELVGRRFLDPYWRAAKQGWQRSGTVGGFFSGAQDALGESGFGVREFVLLGFLLSTAAFLWLQRAAVNRFLRSMHAGVTLVVLSIIAVTSGVLVPQIESFEDPESRVTAANYEEEFDKFAWAEGYFLYHMLHLYGIGMPEEQLSPEMAEGLERFGARYGKEEASNREKRMVAAFTGRQKTEEIRTFIRANEDSLRTAFDWATALHLNRAYKSYWFLTLMVLLGCAIATNTFKGTWRQRIGIKKLGFLVVHSGMLILLVGGGVSKAFTDRGVLHLFKDEGAKDVYWGHFDESKPRRMPFAVRLDHFARQDWKALEVHFLEEEFVSRPPRYTLWEGRVVELDYAENAEGESVPRLRLEVVGLHERAEVGVPSLEEGYDPADPDFVRPYAELEVPDTDEYEPESYHVGDPTVSKFLTPAFGQDLMYDPAMQYRLRVAYEHPDVASLFPAPEQEILGHLLVELSGTSQMEPERAPIRLGETVEVAGGYRVSVVKASKNFQLTGEPPNQRPVPNTRPLRDQLPLNPMVLVQIVPPDGGPTETRHLLEALDPVEYGLQERTTYQDLVLRLRWDHWSSPGPERHVLHWGRDVAPDLIAEDGTRRPVALGRALQLPGDLPVVTKNLFHAAMVGSQNLALLPPTDRADGWDADFYAEAPRGLELRVTRWPDSPRQTTETVRLATGHTYTSDWVTDDGSIGLRFLENSEMLPFEWRSVLSIIERDAEGRPYTVDLGSEEEREIRVNDYFTYEGYRFFQTNAHPEMPDYSGIGVVYDPGIPIVLTGMYVIIAGSVIAFIVRPIVLARRNG